MCLRCGKESKSINGLTRHLNAYIKEVLQTAPLPIHHKLHNDKKNTLDEGLENGLKDGSELLDKINYTVRDTLNLPTKNTPWDRLLATEFLSSLREKWFTKNEFPAGTPISNIKYNHLGVKYQPNFYLFNDQLVYALAHYFVKLETIKGNVN